MRAFRFISVVDSVRFINSVRSGLCCRRAFGIERQGLTVFGFRPHSIFTAFGFDYLQF